MGRRRRRSGRRGPGWGGGEGALFAVRVAVEHVWADGGDDLVGGGQDGAGGSAFDWRADRQYAVPCSGSAVAAGAGGSGGGIAYWRRWVGAWLFEPTGTNRGKVHSG